MARWWCWIEWDKNKERERERILAAFYSMSILTFRFLSKMFTLGSFCGRSGRLRRQLQRRLPLVGLWPNLWTWWCHLDCTLYNKAARSWASLPSGWCSRMICRTNRHPPGEWPRPGGQSRRWLAHRLPRNQLPPGTGPGSRDWLSTRWPFAGRRTSPNRGSVANGIDQTTTSTKIISTFFPPPANRLIIF